MVASEVSGVLGSTDKCRSCGAWIAWAVTVSGVRIPLDLEPVEGGNIAVTWHDHDGYRSVTLAAGERPAAGDTYVTHFASCPNSAKHRGRRRGR